MKLAAVIFCALIGNFILLASMASHPLLRKGFFIWVAAFFILGTALIIVAIKQKIEGKLKFFLILCGASAVGFVASMLLHNFFYGIFQREDLVFFIIAVVVCPVTFLIGTVGSVVMFLKSPSTRLDKSVVAQGKEHE